MTALGVVFRPQLPPERLRGMVRAADDAGLQELWLWEDCFLESGIATARRGPRLVRAAARGRGTAARAPAQRRPHHHGGGHAAPALPRPGHARVGHGVQDWMGQVGARVASPLTLLREHLDAMRALLAGERVTTEGRYVRLDGVALVWPPASAPAVYAGARGPPFGAADRRGGGRHRPGREHHTGRRTPRAAARRRGSGRRRPPRAAAPRRRLPPRGDRPRREARLRAELRRDGLEQTADLGVAGGAEAVAAAVRAWPKRAPTPSSSSPPPTSRTRRASSASSRTRSPHSSVSAADPARARARRAP